MAIIAPFRGLTYNFKGSGDLSKLFAPPYDVIAAHEQEEYYNSHPNNVIRLILGKKRTGDSDWDNRYTRSADYLKRWESEDVIIRSKFPSIYLTSHTYDPGDGSGIRTRWGFIALVRIEDEDSGVILPHEKTFSAHKDDRLKLMRACNAQLSQVFALYDDSGAGVIKELKTICPRPPQVSFDFRDKTSHKMWVIQDQKIFKSVTEALRDNPIFIADGHHRYETSRNYRNIMRARYGGGKGNRSYEFIMMYLSDMNDKGLTILPSHRLVKECKNFRPEVFLERVQQWFKIEEVPFSKSDREINIHRFKELLEENGQRNTSIGFHFRNGDRYYVFTLRHGALDEMENDLHPSLRTLDVMVLSNTILQKCLGFTGEDMDNDGIFHYNSNMADSISCVDSGEYRMAFLLNPTRMEQVKDVAGNSLIMPRKSTYFYPKVLTGLVFNKIDPNENIRIP